MTGRVEQIGRARSMNPILTDAEVHQIEAAINPPRSAFIFAYAFVALSGALVGAAVMFAVCKGGLL